MSGLLLIALIVGAALWWFSKWRPDEFSARTSKVRSRAEGEWQRARERGKEDYEDLKAELREEQEFRRRAAADALAADGLDRPL